MKAKFLKEKIMSIPDEFEVTFSCNGKTDWVSSITTLADSVNGLTDFTITLSEPTDKDVVYVY